MNRSWLGMLCWAWLLLALQAWSAEDPVTHLLHQAQGWESRYRLDLARKSLDKLLRIRPDDPRALAMRVRLAVKEKDPEQARQWLEKLRVVAPHSALLQQASDWLSTLEAKRLALQQARLMARSGRLTEALALYRELFPRSLPEPDIALEYYNWLADSEGGFQAALGGLENLRQRYPTHEGIRLEWIALKLRQNPRNPALLDELYALLDNPRHERRVHAMIRRALFRMEENGDSIPYYRRYLEMDPEDQGVQALLAKAERVEAERRALLANPAWKAGQRGLKLLEQGRLPEAEQALRQAVRGLPKREEFLGGLGQALMRQGRHLEAVPWFERALKHTRYDADKWRSLKQTARFWGLLQQVRTALREARLEDAAQALEQALALQPEQPDALGLRAQLLRQKKDYLAAEQQYRAILQKHPEAATALTGLLETWLEQGKAGQARSAINQLSAQQKQAMGGDYARLQVNTYRAEAALYKERGEYAEAARKLEQAVPYQPDDPWLLYDLARVYLELGRDEAARQLFEKARKADPENTELQYAQALLLDVLDEDRAALETLEALPETEKTENVRRNIQRLRRVVRGDRVSGNTTVAVVVEDEIVDETGRQHHSAEFNAAWDYIVRDETPGKSSLMHTRVPLEYRFESDHPGQWFLRVEPVRLDAGRLNLADAGEVETFGQGLFCLPGCDPRYARQFDRGLALGVGYETDRMRLDVGTTPLGFEVEDVVGGIRYDGSAGWLYWGVDLSRRPLTSTLLTFAGTRDPRTGAVWGGVRKTGISLNAGHDTGGSWGFWSQLDLHKLTGKNVADNRRARLMGGVYWRLINRDDLNLSVGANGHLWWHEKVLDEFTWSQGGYYSPNRYRSLGVNVDAFGRLLERRLSWRLKASYSRSWTYEETTPYFVDEPALQQEAEALGFDPFFRGGPGGGPGYALLGALEYKINRHLSLGVMAEVERSDFYEPNHIGVWLQYHFDGEAPPVHSPPDPLQPYTEF